MNATDSTPIPPDFCVLCGAAHELADWAAAGSERQQFERLRADEARFRGMFENAVEGIFQTTAEGRYLSANPALARIYGYDSPEQLMTALNDISSQLYVLPTRRDDFVEAMQREGCVIDFESEIRRKDGSVIWISENSRAILDAQGRLRCYEGTVMDITRRKQAEAELEAAQRQLMATRDVSVFALAKLAESRDPETGEHLERMRTYAQLLAEQLRRAGPYVDQIDDTFLEDLFRSSPLHDIGKVGIPDSVLLKPGRLTADEFEVMKRHTLIGADTLESALQHTGHGGFLQMAAGIARWHHERFDGSGYPDKLAGQNIPLAARIVALADVYDALTSPRVYKSAYDPRLAREMIEAESGRHFDPVVVDAFRVCYPDFLRCQGLEPTQLIEMLIDDAEREGLPRQVKPPVASATVSAIAASTATVSAVTVSTAS
jgi:PAS domain S-box-containing protein